MGTLVNCTSYGITERAELAPGPREIGFHMGGEPSILRDGEFLTHCQNGGRLRVNIWTRHNDQFGRWWVTLTDPRGDMTQEAYTAGHVLDMIANRVYLRIK